MPECAAMEQTADIIAARAFLLKSSKHSIDSFWNISEDMPENNCSDMPKNQFES